MSPLAIHNTTEYNYNSNKRKIEDTACENSIWPPMKKRSLDLEDHEFLDNFFCFLKSPIDTDVCLDGYSPINEEGVVPVSTSCRYEGIVEVGHTNYRFRSVVTNTMHVPMRRGSSHPTRSRTWRQAARDQYLTDEEQVDERGPRKGTWEDRNQRMVNEIMAYYCR